MQAISHVLQALLLPPGSLGVLALAGLVVRRRRPRTGKAMLIVSLVLLVLLSLPFVSRILTLSLQTVPALPPNRSAPPAEAIVVLSGGIYRAAPEFGHDVVDLDTLERLRYAAWLHRTAGDLPILTSGGRIRSGDSPLGSLMASTLTEEFGVPVRWIDDISGDPENRTSSRGTFGNAEGAAAILLPEGISRIYLVSEASHIRRAVRSFEAVGFTVVPAPTGFVPPLRFGLEAFVPTAEALAASSTGIYEWLARAWYAVRYY